MKGSNSKEHTAFTSKCTVTGKYDEQAGGGIPVKCGVTHYLYTADNYPVHNVVNMETQESQHLKTDNSVFRNPLMVNFCGLSL